MEKNSVDPWVYFELHRTLRAVDNCRNTVSNEVLSSLDITLTQGEILLYLYRCPTKKVETGELLGALQITRSSLSNILKKMRQKGYIQYFNEKGDVRKKQVSLTVKAMEVRREVTEKLMRFEAAMYDRLTESECVQVKEALQKILQNMSGLAASRHKGDGQK